jgi:2-methylisoborneol synthase
VSGDPAELATAVLADMRSAPSGALSALLTADAPEPLSLVFPTEQPSTLGMSAARLPLLLADRPREPAALPPEPAVDDDTDEAPELFCPGPLRDNPALGEEVNERMVEWAGWTTCARAASAG